MVILTALRKETNTEKESTNDNGAILCSLMDLQPPPNIVTLLEDDFNAKFLVLGNNSLPPSLIQSQCQVSTVLDAFSW